MNSETVNTITFEPGTKAYEIAAKREIDDGHYISSDLPLQLPIEEIDVEIMKALLEDGKKIIVSAKDFDMYLKNTGIKTQSDVGPHAMTILDVDTENNKLLVSSWGKAYEIDFNEDIRGLAVYDFD